ncbi:MULTISPECIES: hypothetical protein [unclassified Streptomyces]|uniref:hypothetical protein n=1 Tax=unclassified Streptomyces TaxID=2593676 RepID=UPI002E32183F|nr:MULTISPECIES: hypothetical protein [unclassified Streptomyces]WUC65300.1 hypothetical protein OG861_14165 [Streptomyces sp. NBC_00539]
MGIESDQLVYEYLSRVGDLAQRRQLSSGDRMRLVAGLRDEIDRRRAKYEPETPAAVRRILERIGTPEEVLAGVPGAAASPEVLSAPSVPSVSSVPEQRGGGRGGVRRKQTPEPRPAENVPPHLAGLDELGDGDDGEPDWWRLGPSGYGAGPQVEGFAGGIEIPDRFGEDEDAEGAEGAEKGAAPVAGAAPGTPSRVRVVVRALRERRKGVPAAAAPAAAVVPVVAARPKPNMFLLLAAVVLVAGAVSGYWLVLAVGFLLPYGSRVLGPTERKAVVFGVPGVVFAGAVVWLWGRHAGRWGEALGDQELGAVFQDMWPVLARVSGLVAAAYVAWRSRRA